MQGIRGRLDEEHPQTRVAVQQARDEVLVAAPHVVPRFERHHHEVGHRTRHRPGAWLVLDPRPIDPTASAAPAPRRLVAFCRAPRRRAAIAAPIHRLRTRELRSDRELSTLALPTSCAQGGPPRVIVGQRPERPRSSGDVVRGEQRARIETGEDLGMPAGVGGERGEPGRHRLQQ